MPPAKLQAKTPDTRLIIAASEQDANLYWATQFLAPDPIIYIQHRRKKYLILNDLEADRGRKEASVDHVLRFSELEREIGRRNGRPRGYLEVVAHFLKKKGVKRVAVPYDFPLAYGLSLKQKKIQPHVMPDPFYPERLIKTRKEKAAIKKTLSHVSASIQAAYRVLRESKVKKNRIYWHNKVLTSEILKGVINGHLMENNCLGKHTIVAGGNQGVDPHCEGSGPLPANKPIIMDVFPKSMDSQYYGDMTRTVVKGQATDALRRQWQTVKVAQEHGIKMVRGGVDAKGIHQWIMNYFEAQGYHTGIKNGRMQGFFHGTGHGLGIDIHEAPRVSTVSQKLKPGNVITIEPGLYYSGVGGVRLEDVVYVTKGGRELLSRCPKILEIP